MTLPHKDNSILKYCQRPQLFLTVTSAVTGTTPAKACRDELASRSAKVFLACWWNDIMRSPNCLWAKALFASTPAAFRISVLTLFNPPFRSPSNTLMAEICKDAHCQHKSMQCYLTGVMLTYTIACSSGNVRELDIRNSNATTMSLWRNGQQCGV